LNSRRGKDSDYRLQVAILNNEITRIAYKAGLIASAKKYRPEWSYEDVTQELTAYILHLQQNTNSGFDPTRSKFSTWVTMVTTGWVSKLGRRQPEPTQPLPPGPCGAGGGAADPESPCGAGVGVIDPEDKASGNPESLLQAKQVAAAEVMGIEALLVRSTRRGRAPAGAGKGKKN
jgi:hypothetical protein